MLQYESERIRCSLRGFRLISGTVYGSNCQKIKQKCAFHGWRYVGTIPVLPHATGHIDEMDIVFEKEENL